MVDKMLQAILPILAFVTNYAESRFSESLHKVELTSKGKKRVLECI